MNFRVSQEEYDLINKQVEICGLSKQDYFIQILGEHKINITADYRVADAIAKEVFQLARVIKKFGKLDGEAQDILLYVLGLIGQKTCFANPSKKDNCPLYGVHSRR